MGKHREGSSRPSSQERPPVGTLAEEATQLFAVLSGLAKEQAAQYSAGAESMTATATAAAKSVNEHLATGDAECTYCPVCRVVHAARAASPEAKAHLSAAFLSLAQAASALMAPPLPDQDSEDSVGSAENPEDVAGPADGALHKIDLEADWDQD